MRCKQATRTYQVPWPLAERPAPCPPPPFPTISLLRWSSVPLSPKCDTAHNNAASQYPLNRSWCILLALVPGLEDRGTAPTLGSSTTQLPAGHPDHQTTRPPGHQGSSHSRSRHSTSTDPTDPTHRRHSGGLLAVLGRRFASLARDLPPEAGETFPPPLGRQSPGRKATAVRVQTASDH